MVQDKVCFICGEQNPELIEEHHIVPRRLGGSDNPENLVFLCSSCHTAVERIYDDSFYARLGLRANDLERELATGGIDGDELDAFDSRDKKFQITSSHIQFEQAATTVVIPEDLDADDGYMYYRDGQGREPREERDDPDKVIERDGEVVGDEDSWNFEYRARTHNFERHGTVGWLTSVPSLSEVIDEHREQIEDEMVFNEPCKMVLTPDNPRTTPLVVLINQQWDDKIGTDDYTQYRRLHCSYCDQVFAPFEHALAARHLRVHHHITDVYEENVDDDPSSLLSPR